MTARVVALTIVTMAFFITQGTGLAIMVAIAALFHIR